MTKKILALCAIATAFVFSGCQKEKEVVVDNTELTHSIVFTAEKAGDTRTAIASEGDGVVSYKWIEGDEERMHIYEQAADAENGTEGTITSMVLSNDGKTATFYVTFEGDAPTGTITYSATYGGTVSKAHNPYIPEEQYPGMNTFDPKADALIAEEIVRNARDENPSFRFVMNRRVSVNKMTLKGLPAGDKIESVVFESDKYHSGYITAAGNLTNFGKKLTMHYSSDNTIPDSGEFPVYFTTAPVVEAAFTVTVYTTDNKRYVKSPTKQISFAIGQVRRFGVDMTDCLAPEGRTFTLVESVSDLVIGSDIVIAANGEKGAAMSVVQNENNRDEADATKSADGKTLTVTEQVQIFTLKAGKTTGTYAFLCVNGDNEGYIYAASSSKNWLRTKTTLDDNGSWVIAISNKEATITAQGDYTHNILRRNANDKKYSAYASGQQSVYLYQAAALPAPGMSWSAETATASITSTGIQFDAPTLTPGHATNITYASSKETVATINNSGEVTIVGPGQATITASFAGDNSYAAAKASYTLTVTDNREKVATPTFSPAAGAVDEGTVVTISTTTAGATIYYTTDGTAPTTASTQGTTVTIDEAKTIKAIAVKENYKDSDVATAAYTLTTPGATISTILADNTITSTNTKHYEVSGVTVMANQGKNYIIGDESGVMLMYYNGSPALTVGNVYDVQGDVKMFNNVHEFNNPTVQAATGSATTAGTPEEMTVTSLTAYTSAPVTKYAKVYVTAPETGFICTDGTNSVNVYDGTGTFADYYEKPIIATGYLMGFYNDIKFLATDIEVNPSVSFLVVSPKELDWDNDEYGASSVQRITVAVDDAASGYTVSGSSDDWTLTDDGNGLITVYPKAANTGSADKVFQFTITHDDASLTKTVKCTQAKPSSAVTATVEFLPANMTAVTSGAISATSGPINLAVNNGTVTSSQIRIFKGKTATISSSKVIKKIVFVCTASGTDQYGPGCFSAQTGYTYSGDTGTWEGSSKSVSFTASSNQVRATVIKVTYEE